MSYTIEKSIKLDEIESLTSAIVTFRLHQRLQGYEREDFPSRYDRLFEEIVEKVGANRWLDILHVHPIEKMNQMLAYLYAEMEEDRKHDASGTEYDGPTTDAIESAIKEYQSSGEYQKEVEEYRQWYEAQCSSWAETVNEAEEPEFGGTPF